MVGNQEKRAVGVFSKRQQAEQALNELKASDFSMDKVSIIAKQADPDAQLGGAEMSDRVGDKKVGASTGVVADIATGSILGSVLIGLGSLAIPGIGAVIAAGSVGVALAATVAGTGIEAASTAGLVKAITDLGIPEQQARGYSDALLAGDYLVMVDGTADEISRAEAILSKQSIQHWAIYNPPQA